MVVRIGSVRIMATARTPAAYGLVVTLLGFLLLATGCASVGPDLSQVGSAAQHFHEAVGRSDPGAACELLAPGTLKELEESADTSCALALADAELPQAAIVTSTDVYGTNARVVLDGDTVFLARFGTHWKVTAAGCKPRPGRPYDCAVKGS